MPIKKFSEAELRLLISAMETLIESRKPECRQCSKDLGFLWFLTVDQFSYFYSEYKKSGTSSGWTAVEEFFSKPEVIATITECILECSLVRKRKRIIEKGLRAHLDRDYIASVSILLPQVEGIIWDLGVRSGLVVDEPNSRKKTDNGGKWGLNDLIKNLWNDLPPEQASAANNPFVKKMKAEYYSERYRHSVLHGRDITQFTRKRSTEAVMLVWAASEKTRLLEEMDVVEIDVRGKSAKTGSDSQP